jgi:hypothetical protein
MRNEQTGSKMEQEEKTEEIETNKLIPTRMW